MSCCCVIPSSSDQNERSLCFRLWIPARAGLPARLAGMTKNETMGKNNGTGPKTKVRFAGIMKEENSGNTDSAGTERKARLVGMTKEEYLNNADKTEPSKNAFVLSPDRKTPQTQSRKLNAT